MSKKGLFLLSMDLHPDAIYHIYNRGNKRQLVFFQERNYRFFKQKLRRELGSHVDFLAYALMPNHFHFLVYAREDFEWNRFSKGLRILLSSYTRAVQNQESFVGSLFQQNTKAKELVNESDAHTCFHYIHQNAWRAGLVKKMEDWHHQSFNEYWKGGPGLCNTVLGRALLAISSNPDSFYEESYGVIPDDVLMRLM